MIKRKLGLFAIRITFTSSLALSYPSSNENDSGVTRAVTLTPFFDQRGQQICARTSTRAYSFNSQNLSPRATNAIVLFSLQHKYHRSIVFVLLARRLDCDDGSRGVLRQTMRSPKQFWILR